jgi:hypothetical protein
MKKSALCLAVGAAIFALSSASAFASNLVIKPQESAQEIHLSTAPDMSLMKAWGTSVSKGEQAEPGAYSYLWNTGVTDALYDHHDLTKVALAYKDLTKVAIALLAYKDLTKVAQAYNNLTNVTVRVEAMPEVQSFRNFSLANVLKSRHDTIKNSVGSVTREQTLELAFHVKVPTDRTPPELMTSDPMPGRP